MAWPGLLTGTADESRLCYHLIGEAVVSGPLRCAVVFVTIGLGLGQAMVGCAGAQSSRLLAQARGDHQCAAVSVEGRRDDLYVLDVCGETRLYRCLGPSLEAFCCHEHDQPAPVVCSPGFEPFPREPEDLLDDEIMQSRGETAGWSGG